MDRSQITTVAAAVSILVTLVQFVSGVAIGQWIGHSWIPTVAPQWRMVVADTIIQLIGVFIALFLPVGLGYYIGDRIDVARDWDLFVHAITIGGVAGITVVWAAVLLYVLSSLTIASFALNVFTAVELVVGFVHLLLSVAVVVAIGAIAGASLSHFDTRKQLLG